MPWRYRGRATSLSVYQGYCDRCGFLCDGNKLSWQFQFRGTGIANTGFRVCPTCLDKPSAFLKAIALPADPVPVQNPRPGNVTAQMQQGQPTTWDQQISGGVQSGSPLFYIWDSANNTWQP